MTTKTIFNIDSALKKAAMKKAKHEGLTLSTVLNLALRAYVHDRLRISAFESLLKKRRADARSGRMVSQGELEERLGF